ncbi:class I glutamine amidotransferase-like protein [Paraphaeosphaeria sporulosa]|uniref:Class I glutamine amidotransferase-like protein n=1 Tax=Paraphaeosphaeria sporulosa TaxID=1460663 RepID=A0A177CBW7_9PLEO|nr:class I glutamine amidotransferase-like protein [Paraphaeosphaeria sporulosa]OAG04681.1 class I glutamine amidotransferase-like protein [Paraphaeosphaeria sporulosa]
MGVLKVLCTCALTFCLLANPSFASLNGAIPKKFGIVMFRAFDTTDITAPLEILNFIGLLYNTEVVLLSDTLEPVSTQPLTMNPKNSSVWTTFTPTHTFDTAPEVDVLIVPGGPGARNPNMTAVWNYIAKAAPKTKHVLTICTGSGVAAKAGIMDGRKATTNKAAWKEITAYGPNTEWIPKARWVEDESAEPPIWSSSGVTSGFDMLLQFVEKKYSLQNATYMANLIEHVRITDPSNDPFAVNINGTAA